MFEEIIDTKTKAKLLRAFAERKEQMHASEAARLAGVSKSRAAECLKELQEKGVLESKVVGKSIVYSLSRSIVTKRIVESIRQEKNLVDEISKEFVRMAKPLKPLSIDLFGSALAGLKAGSDVDFFVISDKKEKIYEIVGEITEKFGIRISVMAMNKNEFARKAKKGEEFVINVLANHKLLYGKKLEEFVWPEK